jgi:predicted dehydrogenase
MLDETHPDLVILSPVFGLTGRWIIECAKRGIDVFSEKPVASSREELAAVREAVKRSGIRFGAMHFLRYAPAFYHAGKLVRQGAIGEVKLVNAQKSYKYGTRPDWYADRALYGGTIPWVGIHGVDWIAQFTGKRFLSATALSVGTDPEMAALCQFTLEDNIIAAVNLDFYRPAGAPTHGDDRIRCAGTEGVLEVRDGRVILTDKNGVTEYAPKSAPMLASEFLLGHPCVSPEEIFAVTEAAIAARDSADTGKTVKIS